MTDLSNKLTVAQEKNFVRENILRAKRSNPRDPKWRFVDTRRGDTHDLKSSGLHPIYVHKKNYGKVPRFIAVNARTTADVETEVPTERSDVDKDETPEIPSCRYIDKEERKILLDGMKERWDKTMKLFQGLPLFVTFMHAQKKARLERELQQLEKDIAFIERHPHIYVYDASDA